MPRRSYRRRSSDEGEGGIALLFLFGLTATYRWIEALPRPWQIAAGVFALSAILLLAWSLVSLARRLRRRRRLRAELLALTPTQFEERVQLLLADLGWTQLQRRGGSGDRGVDLMGQYEGERYVIQCKRYTKKVPPAMVRDLVGTRAIQQADRALLVTTSGFTRQGHDEAHNQPVELWDGDALEEQIARADELRADPARARAVRRRRGAILYAGVLINSVLVAYAFATAGPPPLISPAEAVGTARQPTVIAATAAPTAAPEAPTAVPAVTPTASEVPARTAAVFNGGNVQAAPDLQAAVLDQVNAGEQVELLGRSSDGLWLRVSNVRGQVGWTHRTLLTLEPAIVQGLPVVVP
jgi:restriction system protein